MIYLERRTIFPNEVPLDLLLLDQINANLRYFFPFLNHLHTCRILFICSSCIVEPRVGRLTHLATPTAIRHTGLDKVTEAAGPAWVLRGAAGGAIDRLAG